MNYTIKYTDKKDVSLKDAEWSKANVALLDRINWEDFPEKPEVEARLLYNDEGIFVKYVCKEIPEVYCHETNGFVCKDSCAEFFIQPIKSNGNYLNFEVNADKIVHLGLGEARGVRTHPDFTYDELVLENEKNDDSWELKYFIPFALIEKNIGKCEKIFLGNLYKCAEITKTPHFLTYAPVDTPAPDFHQSKFFCEFVLE